MYKRQVNTLRQKADTYNEETNKQMDSSFKNLDETLDSTSEGLKVNPNTEESRKEIEIREYQDVKMCIRDRCRPQRFCT